MPDVFLPFAKPSIGRDELAEVADCLTSGWLTTGPKVARFEKALAKYFQRETCLTVSSATAGLHLVLLALGLQPGDEVITTPLTFVATLNTIALVGAKPVLVDIDPKTLNLNVDAVAAAITPKTKLIMPVHFAGLPVDCDALNVLAKLHGLRIVEDCAHAIGAQYKDKRVGSFGDIQIFSFHPNKNMTTGEGGCVVSNDTDLMSKIELLRFHGICRKDALPYDVVTPGFKYNMMDIQAAIGLHQLARLDDFITERERLVTRYAEQLYGSASSFILPSQPNYSHRHAWHLYCIRVMPEQLDLNREQVIDIFKAQGISIGHHYPAAHLFSYYQNAFGYRQGDFPQAERVSACIMSLPLFPGMTEKQQDRVINVLHSLSRDVV